MGHFYGFAPPIEFNHAPSMALRPTSRRAPIPTLLAEEKPFELRKFGRLAPRSWQKTK